MGSVDRNCSTILSIGLRALCSPIPLTGGIPVLCLWSHAINNTNWNEFTRERILCVSIKVVKSNFCLKF